MTHPRPTVHLDVRDFRASDAGSHRATVLALALLVASATHPHALGAQERDGAARDTAAPVSRTDADGAAALRLDTVVIVRQDLFEATRGAGSFFHRLLEDLHITTRAGVIRQEILLRSGAPWDTALARETERNLRARGLFQEVEVDTATVDGRLAAVVRTRDAWSILPRAEVRVASDGTVTGALGGTETNLIGTGHSVGATYVRQVDRDGMVLGLGLRRLGGTELSLGGSLLSLSDRSSGNWGAGVPFRSLSQRSSLVVNGEAFDGRVLQFRNLDAFRTDTTRWTRRALVQRADAAFAPAASPDGYVRAGISAELRREEFFNRAIDGATVPDTVYGLLGAWAEWRRADFEVVQRLNGFTPDEDVDLSRLVFVALKAAPGGWGWGRSGVGARLLLAEGERRGPLLLRGRLNAQGLFQGTALDSGRVSASATVALKAHPRHASFLHLRGAALEDPAPGREVDLGFQTPPRLWPPHAFSGTRSVLGILEHRWYALEGLLSLLGLGVGGFVEVGGAWYEDQSARVGGDVGLTLFAGSPLRGSAQTVELAAGYRFGGGLGRPPPPQEERPLRRPGRWAVTLGSGIIF